MEIDDPRFTLETITHIHDWSARQRTLRITRPRGFRFTPGQFARLSIAVPGNGRLGRAFSMCSAAWDDELEFLVVRIEGGPFSSALWPLKPGDTLQLDKAPQGFLTIDRFVDGTDLWLLATGTGLAPFVSILRDPATWERFERIVLVHGVRESSELAYRGGLEPAPDHPLFENRRAAFCYLPVVTREAAFPGLRDRIPALLATGALESAAGIALSPKRSRFMLCGSPAMVEDTHRQLMKMGYRLSRLRAPAHIALENGW
ncbi:ferredoxin--NADP reductase [Niveibacterium sp. 24ML]|uniref:ferredoxin--NADP reductase n=1 Tax=Niveibacterium sp. 24ML TaxID=2985512 RepID=UPI00227056A0|nr:ferredoxin--NADP reductase [Niveibacterium sp. 24ML]MCX9156399.1 ferredoxin--NADP reductase [Niveibacterium sp. 24ML]